jgi:hypothetical protein
MCFDAYRHQIRHTRVAALGGFLRWPWRLQGSRCARPLAASVGLRSEELEVEGFDFLSRPVHTPQEFETRLDARVARKAVDLDAGCKARKAIVLY